MTPAILSVGALTAVGLSAEQTAFGVRAGIFCPRAVNYTNECGERLGAVLVPSIHEEIEGWERLVSLALSPLREVLQDVEGRAPIGKVILALPVARPGFAAKDLAQVPYEIADALLGGDMRNLSMISGDREAFATAVVAGKEYLDKHPDEVVLVGAADTYHDMRTYRALDEDYRILSERAPNGFIPGEGAAFVALGRATGQFPALSYMAHAAVGHEPQDDDVLTEVWTKLSRNAVQAAQNMASRSSSRESPWALVDQCTERHRNKRWQIVQHRLRDLLGVPSTSEALAERAGDIGVASGAVLAVYATLGFASGFAPSPSALLGLASDGAARASLGLVAGDGYAAKFR
jgi:3-oxoacyl-[acyl-carrier-protein] synthase I